MASPEEAEKSVVVKFTRGYCPEAYRRVVGVPLVLELFYHEHDLEAHFTVMKYLGATGISAEVFEGAEEGKRVEPLDSRGLVFGDLEEMNIPIEEDGAKLVELD